MEYGPLSRLKKGPKNFDKIPSDVKRLAVVFFVYTFGGKMASFFIPVYTQEIVGSYSLVGIIVSLYGLGTIILDIPVGELLDKVGRRMMMWMGLFLRGVSGVAYYLSRGALGLLSARFIDGLGVSFSWDSAWTVVRDKSPRGLESESLATLQTGVIVSATSAPVIGGFLALEFGLRPLFLVFSGLVFFSLLISLNMKESLEEKEGILEGVKDLIWKDKVMRTSVKDVRKLGMKGLVPLFLIFLYSLNAALIWFIVPLFSRALNADYLLIGGLFSVMYIPGLLRYWFSELSDSRGEEKVIYYFSAAGALFALPLVFVRDIWLLFFLVVAFSLFLQGQVPSIEALMTKVSPKKKMGELTGVFQTFKHLGFFVGPFVAGFIADAFWISAPFILSVGALVLMAVITYSSGFEM